MTPALHLTFTALDIALLKAVAFMAATLIGAMIGFGTGEDSLERTELEERAMDDAAMPWLRHG